jgi:four helix bundle protein
MAPITTFRSPIVSVWQSAIELVKAVYLVTGDFPRDEMCGLTSQMRRAAVSIPSNIAEGTGRGSDPDFRRFLWHSMGSCNELDSQLLLGHDLVVDGGLVLAIGSLGDDKELQSVIKSGDWNQLHIIARGSTVVHVINGRVMSLCIDDDMQSRPDEGLLGLQLHTGPSMKVEFRNIFLVPVDAGN